MKPRHVVAVATLAVPCLLACVKQPKPNCITANGAFATRLIELSREESVPNACAEFGPDSFDAEPLVGMPSYYARDERGQPDYDRGSIAVQSAELGRLLLGAESRMVENQASDGGIYSFGAYVSAEPDGDDFCHVPRLTTAHLVLPELLPIEDDPETEDRDEYYGGQPAVDILLEWSNVRIYVTAQLYGTQFSADLADTRQTSDGKSCTIRYRALGIAPAVSCWAPVEEPEEEAGGASGAGMSGSAGATSGAGGADGSAGGGGAAAETPPEFDPSICSLAESSIHPDARAICDEKTGYCLIEDDSIPALR